MSRYIENAVDAFVNGNASLAKFDRRSLMHDGEWETGGSVPTARIVKKFRSYDVLVDSSGGVILPLHKPDSPELSGEYIEYRTSAFGNAFVYFDTGLGRRSRIDPGDIGSTVVAQRLRFWTSRQSIKQPPSYVKESSENSLRSHPRSRMSSDAEEEFFVELRDFVQSQMEREREEIRHRHHNQNLDSLISDIGGISKLVYVYQTETRDFADVSVFGVPVEDNDTNSSVDITADYGIYPRTEVLLGLSTERTRETGNTFPIEGIVAFISGQFLGIAALDRSAVSSAQLQSILSDTEDIFFAVPLLNRIPYQRELNAIRATKHHSRKRRVLSGNKTLELQPSFLRDFDWREIRLNEFQQLAAERALRARDVFCIHGPPGTGKTRTLRAIIQHAASNGLRILACAHSNQAVDNLLAGDSTIDKPDWDSLHGAVLRGEFEMSRIGSNSNHSVVEEHYLSVDESSANVVCATTSAADQFSTDEFDIAIVDEATQASIPATLIPYVAAERLILAGDHKQLPPYGSSEMEQRKMHVSLFEHLIEQYDEQISTFLRRQYRMNEKIVGFPNDAFYDGELETANKNRSWTLNELDPVAAFDIASREKLTQSKSYKNEHEAEVAIEEVERILDRGADPKDIGIITPYTGQIGTIRSALNQLEHPTRHIKIDTIDSFQGGERDAIVVSFVRSNKNNNSGFLTIPDEGERRLNVALTRARKRLVLIGDFETLGSRNTARAPTDSCADVYSSLFDYLLELDRGQRSTLPIAVTSLRTISSGFPIHRAGLLGGGPRIPAVWS